MTTNPIGQVLLNQFRVDSFVAAGGMGTVYRVWDLKRNVYLAMKVLHADLAEDPSIFKRFQREANALKKLAHPNIVPFYGIYQSNDMIFLLERFIDGPSLKELLRENKGKPLSIEEALTYLKNLTAALGYAHAHGVVHCDVKPGNIMVDKGGNIYLTDFGIARHAESTTTTLATAGTAAYMAPEQIRGLAVTAATDVYTLGILMFEMLTGRRPFRGDETGTLGSDSTISERIRNAHLELNPPDPRSIKPDIPPALAQVVLKALNKSPNQRYPSVQDLLSSAYYAAGLDPAYSQDQVKLAPTPVVPEMHSVPSTAQEQYISQERSKTGLWITLGLGGSVVILLSAIAWILWNNQVSSVPVIPTPIADLPATEDMIIPATEIPPLPTSTHLPPPTLTQIPTSLPTLTQIPTSIPTSTTRPQPSPTKTNLPSATPIEPARLILDKNYFCRGGPGADYPELWTFYEGDELEIFGRNGDTWWLVKIDDERTRKVQCWIGGGIPTGDISQVPHSNWTGDGYTP